MPLSDLFNGLPEGRNNVITERSVPKLKYKQFQQLLQLQQQVSEYAAAGQQQQLVSVMHTTRAVSAGEELINNYGRIDADELLLRYGVW